MSNAILEKITAHLTAGADRRVVAAVQGGYRAPVFAPKDLPKMKADGTGVRVGRTYFFASQIRFARVV